MTKEERADFINTTQAILLKHLQALRSEIQESTTKEERLEMKRKWNITIETNFPSSDITFWCEAHKIGETQ